jgi:hypothetical protein
LFGQSSSREAPPRAWTEIRFLNRP